MQAIRMTSSQNIQVVSAHTHTQKEESLFWNQKVPAQLITLSLTLTNTYILITIHSEKYVVGNNTIQTLYICPSYLFCNSLTYFMSIFESTVRPPFCLSMYYSTQNRDRIFYPFKTKFGICIFFGPLQSTHLLTSILLWNLVYWLLFNA